jgi:hypothetical protein
MKRIAIDIVLLPSKNIMNTIIAMNRKLSGDPQKIQLDSSRCYPHISLAMGVMTEEVFTSITKELGGIAGRMIPRSCVANGIHEETISTGEIITTLEIQPSTDLMAIHRAAIDITQRYCTYDADLDMLYPKPPPETVTLDWINNFPQESSYEAFRPHITLGSGTLHEEGGAFPLELEIESLCLCHLGNYCTCREILFRFSR